MFSLVLDLIRATRRKVTSSLIEASRSKEWKNFSGAYIDECFTIGYLTSDEYFSFLEELRSIKRDVVELFYK